MSHKHLLVQSAAREKILHGASALVCNDGVTIAKKFELEDHEEDLGVQIIRQAAERTGDLVGDGPTTSTLMAAAIFAEGVKNIAAGASGIELKRGLDCGLAAVAARLKELSRPVADQRQRVQVATISVHNDADSGEIVAEALEKVGVEGTTTVEEAKLETQTRQIAENSERRRNHLRPPERPSEGGRSASRRRPNAGADE